MHRKCQKFVGLNQTLVKYKVRKVKRFGLIKCVKYKRNERGFGGVKEKVGAWTSPETPMNKGVQGSC